MTSVAIRIENLGKKYRVGVGGGPQRLSEALERAPAAVIAALFRRRAGNRDGNGEQACDFWALKDISFDVRQGEVVGVIGHNGAGKSTLLKILSHITEPTIGRFGLRGRVASLLEVGAGFHPELTGRENIFLSGALL